MAAKADTSGRPALAGQRWSACSPDAVAEEKPKPGWRRFLDQYRSYLQLILVTAAVVSLAIKEWSTGVLLLVLTLARQLRPGHPP